MSSEDRMTLPPALSKLYSALVGRGDVPIDDLYRLMFERDPPKDAQQRLGSYIVKLNRRLVAKGLAVKPGQIKRTYRLHVL